MRKFLVVLDDTRECLNAMRFAAMRASHTGGGVEVLAIIPPEEFNHWIGVGELMRAEARERIEAHFFRRFIDRFGSRQFRTLKRIRNFDGQAAPWQIARKTTAAISDQDVLGGRRDRPAPAEQVALDQCRLDRFHEFASSGHDVTSQSRKIACHASQLHRIGAAGDVSLQS